MSQQNNPEPITAEDLRLLDGAADRLIALVHYVQDRIKAQIREEEAHELSQTERIGTPTTVNVSFSKKARQAHVKQKNPQPNVDEESR